MGNDDLIRRRVKCNYSACELMGAGIALLRLILLPAARDQSQSEKNEQHRKGLKKMPFDHAVTLLQPIILSFQQVFERFAFPDDSHFVPVDKYLRRPGARVVVGGC